MLDGIERNGHRRKRIVSAKRGAAAKWAIAVEMNEEIGARQTCGLELEGNLAFRV